ncbi:pre-rRNA-processing protein PNO1 [Nanoarchaeota archaeon]
MEYSYEVKIPKDRVAVLIGKGGSVKKKLEEMTNVSIDVDSQEGQVTITGSDSITMFQLRGVVKAVGRGFNPDVAQLLLKQDYALEIVNIHDFVKDTKNHVERVRGRVIGTEGKARKSIEVMTETFISVYGKTVSIIGTIDKVQISKNAVVSILQGAPHGPVYNHVEESMQKLKKRETLG